MNLAENLRRYGARRLAGLAGSALLLLAASATLAAGGPPGLALAFVSAVLLYLLVCVAVLQRRLLTTMRSLKETQRDQRRLRYAQQEHNRQIALDDYPNELERIEALQKKILAAVETGRLENAERFEALRRGD